MSFSIPPDSIVDIVKVICDFDKNLLGKNAIYRSLFNIVSKYPSIFDKTKFVSTFSKQLHLYFYTCTAILTSDEINSIGQSEAIFKDRLKNPLVTRTTQQKVWVQTCKESKRRINNLIKNVECAIENHLSDQNMRIDQLQIKLSAGTDFSCIVLPHICNETHSTDLSWFKIAINQDINNPIVHHDPFGELALVNHAESVKSKFGSVFELLCFFYLKSGK